MVDIELNESPLQLGGKFLKYDVSSVIGRGGFAWVYRGYDAFMGRDVAIKILHRKGGVTDDMLRRGQAEAKLLSRLRHPHIVEIYDAGVSDQNLLYIIMELLVGRSLNSVLQSESRLTLSEGLPLFLEIADAFETAHRMGAIHRDIKPDNIFVTDGNHAKVLDFGIAKITDGSNPLTTNQGMMIGTMKYMSPEQVQGQRVTPSSDIYCLGLVMYEAFGGIHPCFVNTDDASYRALAYKQIVEIPPSLESIAKGIPRELSRLVDRCISKRISERFQSMAELVKALQACAAKLQRDGAAPRVVIENVAPPKPEQKSIEQKPPEPEQKPPPLATPAAVPPVSRSVPVQQVHNAKLRANTRGNGLWWSAILAGGVLGSVAFAGGTHWFYGYLVSQRRNLASDVVRRAAAESVNVPPTVAVASREPSSSAVPPPPAASSVAIAPSVVTPVAASSRAPSTPTRKTKKAKLNSMDAKLKAFEAEQAAERQWDPTVPIFKGE
jgi:serine/threonine protein kinase